MNLWINSIAGMFEFIWQILSVSDGYYLSSILLPMLRLSCLWPLGVLFGPALVPFHEKLAQILPGVLTAVKVIRQFPVDGELCETQK